MIFRKPLQKLIFTNITIIPRSSSAIQIFMRHQMKWRLYGNINKGAQVVLKM